MSITGTAPARTEPVEPNPRVPRPRRRGVVVVALALAVVANIGAAVQSRVNGDLGTALGDGALAALVSTGVGLVLLSLLAAVRPSARAGLLRLRDAVRDGRLRRRQCLGGMCGGYFVAGQALTVPRLGVALFTVAVVAGSAAGSLVVDARGWSPGGRRPVTCGRALGAGIVLVAVLLVAGRRLDDGRAMWVLALPVTAGAAIAWQTGANGIVSARARSAFAATWLNFALAVGSLAPVVLAERGAAAARGGSFLLEDLPTSGRLYAGGVLGVALIGAATVLVGRTGVLLFGLAAVAGQMIGAVTLDALAGHRLPVTTWAGAAATVMGVAVAAGVGNRRRDGIR